MSLENIKAIEDNLNTKDVNGFLNQLGVDINSLPNDGKIVSLFKTSIDPETCGLASFIFKTLELEVKAGKDDQEIWVYINYNYTHPGGGSNGKNIICISRDNGQTWTV